MCYLVHVRKCISAITDFSKKRSFEESLNLLFGTHPYLETIRNNISWFNLNFFFLSSWTLAISINFHNRTKYVLACIISLQIT